MQSATIIDFMDYLNRKQTLPEPQNDKVVACADELSLAIQALIQKMRK